MALLLTDLEDRTKIKVADIAKTYPNEPIGIGDGTSIVFYALYPPIKTNSQSVYIDGVLQTITTDYTIDLDLGKVTFVSAPLANTKITIDYVGLYLSDTDMTNIVTLAVSELALVYPTVEFTVSGSNISPNPTKAEESLLLLQARLSVVEAEAFRTAREVIRTARTGVSVDTTARATSLSKIIDYLKADLEVKCDRENIRQANLCSDDRMKV